VVKNMLSNPRQVKGADDADGAAAIEPLRMLRLPYSRSPGGADISIS